MSARLILCRHGATALNRKPGANSSAERIRGWIDVPLDSDGRQQAKELAARFEDTPLDAVYASPLVRAKETAERIAIDHDLTLIEDRGLMPWNLGSFSGQPVQDVVPRLNMLTSHEDTPAPGGESFRQFRERALGTLIRLLSKSKRDGQQVCAVSHTRNMQLAKAWLAAGAEPSMRIDRAVMNDYSNEVGTGGVLLLGPQ